MASLYASSIPKHDITNLHSGRPNSLIYKEHPKLLLFSLSQPGVYPLTTHTEGETAMPPPDKFDDRWYTIGAIILAILVALALMWLYRVMPPTTI